MTRLRRSAGRLAAALAAALALAATLTGSAPAGASPAPCESWTGVPPPSPGSANFLQAIKPVSANDAWAVGTYSSGGAFKTLTAHWDGTAWTQVTSPNPGPTNELESVAATSASNAWAVGISSTPAADQTLIL